MKPFLDVNWDNLLVASYRVDPAILEKHRPPGTELDIYEGNHYVSIVAFEFKKTKICGIPMPLYLNFAEINLRFHVQRKVDGEWRRGVVFVKEIVPCRIPAIIARYVFGGNFHVHPLKCKNPQNQTRTQISYIWDHQGQSQEMITEIGPELNVPEPGSLNEHIIDHYWAYRDFSRGEKHISGEFHVTHRPWKVQPCPDADIQIDIARVYGREWAEAMELTPDNVFYADGS